MSPVSTIALLLLSTAVIRSLEVQTEEEEEDFLPELKHDVRRRADHLKEEIVQEGAFPGSCSACTNIVSRIKKKLGNDHSKAKIGQMLNNICNRLKNRVIRSACKSIVRKFKNKLINAIANAGTPRRICVRIKLCKKNKLVYR